MADVIQSESPAEPVQETGSQLTLRSSPTGGLAGEHSPFYRRLISAGYKGFQHGAIGGATFYGATGLAIGALVAIPAAAFFGANAFWLIPVMAGLGFIEGASIFGRIGSTAAALAESGDLLERRRELLQRYRQLPDGPEGDREAALIRTQLDTQMQPHEPTHLFHWKTVLVGTAFGTAIALGGALLAPSLLAGATAPVITALATHGIVLGATALTSIVTAMGALAGAAIGIDREHIRRWFDMTEAVVYDRESVQEGLLQRQREVDSLTEAERRDKETARAIRAERAPYTDSAPAIASYTDNTPVLPEPPVTEKPTPRINTVQLESRLADIRAAMSRPVI